MKWKAKLVVGVLLSLLFSNELVPVGRQIEGIDEGIFEGSSFAATTFERGWVGVMLSGGPLYWYPKIKNGGVASAPAQFGWDWGYRLKGGIFLPVVGYNVFGTYTHFGSKVEDSHLGSVKVKHLISYNSLDVDFENGTSFDQIWGTFWGIRKVWVDRTQVMHSGSPKEGCYFRGIGPRIGVGLRWHLFYGIDLFLDGAASLLYGKARVSCVRNQSELEGSSRIFSANLNPHIGLGWSIYENWYHFGLFIGYESEYYWSQNRTVEVGKRGSLQILRRTSDQNFHGVTLKALIEF